jgi:hypothetical protein
LLPDPFDASQNDLTFRGNLGFNGKTIFRDAIRVMQGVPLEEMAFKSSTNSATQTRRDNSKGS